MEGCSCCCWQTQGMACHHVSTGAAAREVYSCARSQLMKNYLLVTKKLVGIKHHVEQVIKCLNQGVQVVGIVGMGGLGKTTMAMAVRDEVYTKFSYCCFLSNVRVTLLEKGGILALQKKIISTISGHEENILDESQGIRMIKDRVSKHKALIIIDDVDETFEFGDIFGNLEDFSSESRFIITTRDKRVFQSFQQEEVYEPNEMDLKHSLQLFSKHAFGFDYPPKGWVKMSEEFVKVATHLPLALKVIGATLHRKKEGFWNARLDKLRKIPLAEVQMRLMTSYSDLSEEEKQIFLDIACNFIGEDKEHPFHMWRNCDFFPDDGVDTLIFKSLLKIDERNKFWMHDSIRELGRGIVRKEDPRRPWRRSRIWTNEDALKMVTYEEETDQLEIFSVRFEYDTFKLTKRKFDKMSKLRYLKVYGGNFEENFESNLPNLRWLQLIGCHSLPNDMNLKGLVLFQLEKCGGVTDDWSGWAKIKGAHNLKAMDIGNCPGLRKVPDLSRCRNLELLNIKGIFMEAQKLPTSLKRLYLSSLYISNLVHLINLEKLYISDYEHSFPWDMWKLSKLKSIKLMSFRPQSLLQDSGSSRLPSSLIKLHIRYAAMERLPNLDNLNSLTKLVLWNTEVIEIPGLAGLRMLESLEIKGARQLMHLQGLEQLKLIEVLIVGTCQVLETLPSLRNLTKIHRLWIYGCKHLTEVTGFENLKKLKWLMIDERLIPSSLDRTQVNINREYDALW
ncbi:Disease resistance protein L6 [Linum perenne]